MEERFPILLEYASPSRRSARPMALIGIAGSAVLAGAMVGATTNAIDGVVSPVYFVNLMGWPAADVWILSIARGVLDGSLIGLLFSIVLTTGIAIISRASCRWTMGLRVQARIMLAIYCMWIVGGVCGWTLGTFEQHFIWNTFPGVPNDPAKMVRFAWVSGSIWGAEYGGFFAVIFGLVRFRSRWQLLMKHQLDTPVADAAWAVSKKDEHRTSNVQHRTSK